MRALGIRAEKDCLHWAIVDRNGDEYKIVADHKLGAPKSYEEPAALAWYRERIQTLVVEHSPQAAAIRYSETYLGARIRNSVIGSLLKRARIEGVVIEALETKGIPIGIGAMQQISSRLGSRSAKHYVADGEFRGLDLTTVPELRREAVLVAASMLENK